MTVRIMSRDEFDRLHGDEFQTHHDAFLSYEKYVRRMSQEVAGR